MRYGKKEQLLRHLEAALEILVDETDDPHDYVTETLLGVENALETARKIHEKGRPTLDFSKIPSAT